MKFRSVYLLAALPLIVGATMSFAIANPGSKAFNLAQASEDKVDRWQEFREKRRNKMIEALNLSDEQLQQLEAIRGDEENQSREKYEALKAEMETLRSLVSNSASASELRSQHQKIQALRQEMGSERFEKMLKMYEILTPEQRKSFAEKMKMRHGRRGHFGGRKSRHERPEELQSLLRF